MCDDEYLVAEDIAEVNELKLQREWLEALKAEYQPQSEGHFNGENDSRIVELVNMVLRCGTYNEGLTRILLQ
jgi:hypothetical protein